MSAENTSYILMAISGTTAIICLGFAFYFSQQDSND
jgi:F0F1-type ATP synthase membrane subunit c/vacuolar-type H+-ATPase subunit K